MGKFVGILRGSLVFRANRWNIGVIVGFESSTFYAAIEMSSISRSAIDSSIGIRTGEIIEEIGPFT